MATRILHISDIHLFADASKELLGVKTQESFQAVCDKILAEESSAQAILLSGDLSQDNTEASYLRLAKMVKPLQAPIYYVPGNHDDPRIMAQLFPRDNILNDKQVIINNWQIILLNSQKPGAVEGFLNEGQFAFLQDCLATYPQHNTIVVFHHHPFPVGSEWLDNIRLINADEFWQFISPYSTIRTVLFGHVHQEHARRMNQIACYSAPSTCFQFMRHQNDFGLEKLAPGYRWLDLHEDGRIDTGVNRVTKYIGKFDENAKGY